MPRLQPLCAALAVVSLSGCVAYQPKPLEPARTQVQIESRRLDDAGFKEYLSAHGQPADADWDLSRLTLAALYFSPALDVARAELAEAEAGVRTAQARPNPTLSFSPAYSTDTAGGVTPWILGYALEVPMELAGKRGHRANEARQRVEIARLHLAAIAWSAHSAARRALIDLHAAESTAELWRRQAPLLDRTAQLLEAQVGAGEGSPLLAAQARIALNRAQLATRESERASVTARSRLAEAIGVPLAALSGVPLSYRGLAGDPGRIVAAEARTWAARNRADLLVELAAYAAAESALQGEIARQYPDLAFGPGYEFDQGEGKWSLAIGVTLPVFHQNQGPIAAARARREIAAARFLAVQNRVLAEVDRALSDYSSGLGDLETVRTMRENLERQARIVGAQQRAGETSQLDLVRAQIELADNARTELDARIRAERALATLEDAVQRPLGWPETAWREPARLSTSR